MKNKKLNQRQINKAIMSSKIASTIADILQTRKGSSIIFVSEAPGRSLVDEISRRMAGKVSTVSNFEIVEIE